MAISSDWSTCILWFLPSRHSNFGFLCFTYYRRHRDVCALWAFLCHHTEILPGNVTAGAIALINSFGALGSFAGSYIVGYLNGTTGGFGASYIFMAGSLFLSAVITLYVLKSSGNTFKKGQENKRIDESLPGRIVAE